jgi:tripartite-type tricarboxylate transporter receptor subunit TctC
MAGDPRRTRANLHRTEQKRRPMRAPIRTALLAACMTMSVAPSMALYPERIVQLISPFPAGGAADVSARIFSKELEARLGQPFVVMNRPGGGTIIGAQATMSAEPDGYTIMLSSNSTYSLIPRRTENCYLIEYKLQKNLSRTLWCLRPRQVL